MCVMATMVRPFLERSFNSPIISMSRSGESPLVGSSRKMTLGSDRSSMAMETRFFCPPEREEMRNFSLPSRRTSAIASFTRSLRSASETSARIRSMAV